MILADLLNKIQPHVIGWIYNMIPSQPSVLINGGFDVYQRQDPTVPTSRSDDTYGPDRWYVLVQTGAINVHRVSGDTSSQYAARLTQAQATAQRFGIAQIVEAANSIPLRQRAVRFQVRVKPSTSTTIRAAILAWQGAEDSVVSDVVNDWSSASYIPGGFFAAANLTVIGTAAVTASPDQYSDLAVTGVVSANCNNLIVVVWTESAVAQNVTLEVTQAGLYDGATPRAWLPRPAAQELALCQRYFFQSSMQSSPTFSSAVAEVLQCLYISLPVPMRVTPTVMCYDDQLTAGNITYYDKNGVVSSRGAPYDVWATPSFVEVKAYTVSRAFHACKITADAEL